MEGFRSQEDKVLSGVPHGTVLGPLLFLLHINDLPSVVTSQVKLFADDCLLYRPILSGADRVTLQRDLDSLEKWCDTWGMVQCKEMSNNVHHQRKVPSDSLIYIMHLCAHVSHVLSSVQESKYLGITFTGELSWSSHVRSIHNRANSTLGFLRRNLRRCPAKVKETAYITLVRSTLEYAAPVWDPHLARDCDLLEKIQRHPV